MRRVVRKPKTRCSKKYSYRSGLEETVHQSLSARGIDVPYEARKIPFTQPAKARTYTPDFILPNGIVIETKGLFTVEDRMKHLMIKEQYPQMDLRFVFTNANARISKRSNTRYKDWCDKHGFKWAHKEIPDSWLK